MDLNKLTLTAIDAALAGGKEIIDVYNKEDFEVEIKSDNSPLTIADKNANDAIVAILNHAQLPILSEEGKELMYQERKGWELLWIVDPLDGTKEFIKRNGEFTVNIALAENGRVILGVIYVPIKKELYFAHKEVGAYKLERVGTTTTMPERLEDLISHADKLPLEQERKYTVVGSRSHMSEETTEFIESLKEKHGDVEILSRGSSLKICMVAEGSADVYPRFAPTMEWDTAAGQAIAECAGFDMLNYETNTPLWYNKENLLNPWFIVKSKGNK